MFTSYNPLQKVVKFKLFDIHFFICLVPFVLGFYFNYAHVCVYLNVCMEVYICIWVDMCVCAQTCTFCCMMESIPVHVTTKTRKAYTSMDANFGNMAYTLMYYCLSQTTCLNVYVNVFTYAYLSVCFRRILLFIIKWPQSNKFS